MTNLQKDLAAHGEKDYAAFSARLIPTVAPKLFLGVRVPVLRKLAAEFEKTDACAPFLSALPHTYYEENLLHAILLSRIKTFDTCLAAVDAFLPYIDNWAVCDSLRPRVFAKHKADLLRSIHRWVKSDAPYTRRFGIEMLMTHFLDDDFSPDLIDIAARAACDEYYVGMMIAWYFATALAKQWDAALPYLKDRRLPPWIFAKTVQKACESFRITPAQKALLRGL